MSTSTRNTVRPVYADSWDAFIKKVDAYSPRKRAALHDEARTDGKLAMIVALSADWRARYSGQDAAARVVQAQARIVEERRMALDPSARRSYVAADTQALMPPLKARRRVSADRHRDAAAARDFWAGMERGRWRGRDLPAILDQCREPRPLRLLALPYGPPVSQHELNTLQAAFRSMRPRSAAPTSINPAGMTPERALAIAMGVQARR